MKNEDAFEVGSLYNKGALLVSEWLIVDCGHGLRVKFPSLPGYCRQLHLSGFCYWTPPAQEEHSGY